VFQINRRYQGYRKLRTSGLLPALRNGNKENEMFTFTFLLSIHRMGGRGQSTVALSVSQPRFTNPELHFSSVAYLMTLYPTSFILQRPVLGDCDRRMKKLRVE
jgi:hypothetical protein